MSKPEEIPADVWSSAESALDDMLCNCIEASGTAEQFRIDSIEPIARAIVAERERCAAVADGYSNFIVDTDFGVGYKRSALNIAAAIRKGGAA